LIFEPADDAAACLIEATREDWLSVRGFLSAVDREFGFFSDSLYNDFDDLGSRRRRPLRSAAANDPGPQGVIAWIEYENIHECNSPATGH
jgi:hypothetical protein